MVVVAVVSGTVRAEEVLFEAAGRADDHGTELHVLYVMGLSWYAKLELALSKRIGIPVGTDRIRDVCERRAARTAEPVVDDFEAVGLVGIPVDEIVDYTRRVGTDCVVLDADVRWGVSSWPFTRNSLDQLRERGVTVVPVY